MAFNILALLQRVHRRRGPNRSDFGEEPTTSNQTLVSTTSMVRSIRNQQCHVEDDVTLPPITWLTRL